MNKEVSLQKIQQDAENYFKQGNYYCSEAIVASIRENFDLDMPEEMVAMASGFPVGIGRSKCVCGAVSGGVMAIGYFFGRTKGTNPKDPRSVKTLELANELQESFKKNHKVLCCSILTKGMDMASGEHKAQCVSFTGEVARSASEIIIREMDMKNIDEAQKEV